MLCQIAPEGEAQLGDALKTPRDVQTVTLIAG
jgi:hypothetical protein